MNCPVCNRNNANTLSICPSCGAMINDSVREELKGKISAVTKTARVEQKGKFSMPKETNQSIKIAGAPKPISAKADASAINSPPSLTLVEFHSKNTTVPEWRLQLQNTVRQRYDRSVAENGKASFPLVQKTKLVMSGATALKAEPIGKIEELEIARVKNPTLSSALERIKNSRQKFLLEEEQQLKNAVVVTETPKPNKNYPFYIAGKTTDAAPHSPTINAPANFSVEPTIVVSPKIEREDLEANKLPALPKPAPTASSLEKQAVIFGEEAKTADKDFEEKIEVVEKPKAEIKIVETKEAVNTEAEVIETDEAAEEIDDCAPFAMRFNAGLFDLIIGSFASLLLLSPFILTGGGNWLTIAGIAAFLATLAVIMFIYLTTAIGKYGKTIGMRLFSLEVIDIEDEQYPTLHQAAVSSALYLVSLAFGGLGFVTMFFNEEKRAVHDLVSGTVVVKEF